MRRVAALAAIGLAGAACHDAPRPAPPAPAAGPTAIAVASATSASAVAVSSDAGVPDAAAAGPVAVVEPKFETWRAGDFEIVTSLPLRRAFVERRPVVVGIHGSNDRPDATCARWRRALGGYPFIVCPEGVPYRRGLAWGAASGVAERIDRALAGLRERHGDAIVDGPMVYAGWSLGATRGPAVVGLKPGAYEVVILAEVGHTRLDAGASARSLTAAKVTHTLVACATNKCANFAKRLKAAPGLALLDGGIGRGHVFDDRMAAAIGAGVAEAVADDPRWSGLRAALELGLPKDEVDPPLPPADDEPDLVPSE